MMATVVASGGKYVGLRILPVAAFWSAAGSLPVMRMSKRATRVACSPGPGRSPHRTSAPISTVVRGSKTRCPRLSFCPNS